jgi:D-alanyl-D-alanine carboxypeptidase (penicillin-binding protein 5/6)
MRRGRLGGVAVLTALLACALVPAVAGSAQPKPSAPPRQRLAQKRREAGERRAEARARAARRRSAAAQRRAEGAEHGLHVQARAWALVDARSGDVLLSSAANRQLPIASTTKLMTAWVVLHELPLDRIVTAAPYHPEYGESLMGLRAGETVSVRDLLYGLILLSGNDAAHTLAIAAAGSTAAFVGEMNRRAAALGLSHTHYANPVGLDQKGNYSSALDLATLTRHLLRVPAFARIADSRSAYLRSTDPPRRIKSINELLEDAPWITGVKTGHTFGALYVLVGSGRRKGIPLISDVIGAPSDEDRFAGNLELLEYGFRQYRRREPVRAGQDLADPSIRYAGGELPLRAARAVVAGVRRGQQVEVKVRAPAEVDGPIRRGAVLGRATVLVDGLLAGTTPLRAGRSIPEASVLDRVRDFLANHWMAIALATFVILMGGVLLYRRQSRRPTREIG